MFALQSVYLSSILSIFLLPISLLIFLSFLLSIFNHTPFVSLCFPAGKGSRGSNFNHISRLKVFIFPFQIKHDFFDHPDGEMAEEGSSMEICGVRFNYSWTTLLWSQILLQLSLRRVELVEDLFQIFIQQSIL